MRKKVAEKNMLQQRQEDKEGLKCWSGLEADIDLRVSSVAMESETVPSNYLPKGRHINWKEERALIGALGDTPH